MEEYMEEFVRLKNELFDLTTEKHKNENLEDIIIFKFKVNGEISEEDQKKLKELYERNAEIFDKSKKIRERILELQSSME